jgi:hypothetical protein
MGYNRLLAKHRPTTEEGLQQLLFGPLSGNKKSACYILKAF